MTVIQNTQTKPAVLRWMKSVAEDYVDGCGEIDCTSLAENAADEFHADFWLDDPNHWVWDLAVDVEAWYFNPA